MFFILKLSWNEINATVKLKKYFYSKLFENKQATPTSLIDFSKFLLQNILFAPSTARGLILF